ncbi:hypothetical protein E2P81_ATG02546 [Venturia nashicola]|uniref:Uncharacterized protein n=1 Tax=Venturia nashicola TaxID=86259 RepID=A0A4Z1PNL4_9PEZI|nr:hypothetical protein E6O75_ATG02607 [Venturia nashicola]TLD36764.1 hypothetical protein E2P81_ATG02546 [Venturia nashicola]
MPTGAISGFYWDVVDELSRPSIARRQQSKKVDQRMSDKAVECHMNGFSALIEFMGRISFRTNLAVCFIADWQIVCNIRFD